MKRLALVLFLVGIFTGAAFGSGITVTASGSGWVRDNGTYNNDNVSIIDNLFVNYNYHDWISFAIPQVGVITNATLSIWNDGSNVSTDPEVTFTSHAASGIDWLGLVAGSPLGAQNVSAADTGAEHYVDIVLNATALNLLNAAQGNLFIFGGGVDTDEPSSELFGYTGGTPSAQLILNETVPEPSTFLLLGAGLGGLAFFRRKARKQ